MPSSLHRLTALLAVAVALHAAAGPGGASAQRAALRSAQQTELPLPNGAHLGQAIGMTDQRASGKLGADGKPAERVLKAISGTGNSSQAWIPTDLSEWNYTLLGPKSKVEAQVASMGKFWTRSLLRAASMGTQGHGQLVPLLRRLREGQPITVVALGSSIVSGHAGCFSSSKKDLLRMAPEHMPQCTTDTTIGNKHGYLSAFMEVVNRTFPHPGHTVINVGWPGRSMDSYTQQSCLEDYLPAHADLILLEQHEKLPEDPGQEERFEEQYLGSLERLLWRLQALLNRSGQRVPVVLLSMFWLEFGTKDSNLRETFLSCTHNSPLGYAPPSVCHDACMDPAFLEHFPVAPPTPLPADVAATLRIRPVEGWSHSRSAASVAQEMPTITVGPPRAGATIKPFSSLQLGVLAEDLLEPLLDYYGHTGVSLRNFLIRAMKDGVLKELNMTTPCQLAAAVLGDSIHPSPNVGRGLIADLLLEQLVMAQEQEPEIEGTLIDEPSPEQKYPTRPLVLVPDALLLQHTMRCYRLQGHSDSSSSATGGEPLSGSSVSGANSSVLGTPKPSALIVESKGWQFVEYQMHGTERKYKPGWVATEPGSVLVVELDTTFKAKAPSEEVDLAVLYLKSYEHMGQARVSCASGCTCAPVTLDALDASEAVSITVDRLMKVSQHTQCRIKLEVLPTSSGPEHKWKLIQINVSSEKMNPRPRPPKAIRRRWI